MKKPPRKLTKTMWGNQLSYGLVVDICLSVVGFLTGRQYALLYFIVFLALYHFWIGMNDLSFYPSVFYSRRSESDAH